MAAPTIRTVAETGSTNADLLADAAAGAPEGQWLRAERQSGGRGRLGRAWTSPPDNLYASTIVRLRPGDPPAPSLALVAGLATHETAFAWAGGAGATLRLKWPNDLLADGTKLAGILLERSGDAVVAGIGVNLATAPDLPDRAAVSLAVLAGAPPPPSAFLHDLADAFARRLAIWRGRGLGPIRDAWIAAAHPIGTALATTAPSGQRIEGLFDGLDPTGNLLLRRADGRRETVHAGDVILI